MVSESSLRFFLHHIIYLVSVWSFFWVESCLVRKNLKLLALIIVKGLVYFGVYDSESEILTGLVANSLDSLLFVYHLTSCSSRLS